MRKASITVFLSDFRCTYMTDQEQGKALIFDEINLEPGVVVNGKIEEPITLFELLKSSFKQKGLKIRYVKILIHDQNILLRQFDVDLTHLQKKSFKDYLLSESDQKIAFPFENIAVSHFVKAESNNKSALALITDEDILQDYYDVFERLGATEVTFDLPSLSLYELYKEQVKSDSKHVMLVTFYDSILAIQVFENHQPVFQMIEECNKEQKNYYLLIENYIERVANYYKYNLKKGKAEIDEVGTCNLSSLCTEVELQKEVLDHLDDYKTYQLDFRKIEAFDETMPKGCMLPLVSNDTADQAFQIPFEFKLSRVKKSTLVANYVFLLAFLIFTMVTLIYIPYYLMSEDIKDQENINHQLEDQLYYLQLEDQGDITLDPNLVSFNADYESLSAYEKEINQYIVDMLTLVGSNIDINYIALDGTENALVIQLSANSSYYLDHYVTSVYETFGISPYIESEDRWITVIPEVVRLSDTLMEVTLYYA